MKSYKSIIIDDERLARLELRRLLSHHPEIDVVAEAAGVDDAIRKINDHQANLLFLDIQLKGETGFDLLNRIEFTGKVIFVTAYDQYAIRAFEVNALDYLQKPVSLERLSMALKRLPGDETIQAHEPIKALNADDLIFLTFGKTMRFLKVNEILLIKAEGQYTEVLTVKGEKGLVSQTMKEWESRLPGNLLIRVHRSYIINIAYIQSIRQWSNHSFIIELNGVDQAIVASRRFSKRIRELYK